MRDELGGTWILQEYEDSTDAGLTPKLLEYMFNKWNQISYDVASGKARIFSLSQMRSIRGFYDTEYLDSCAVYLYPQSDKINFHISYPASMHRPPISDTAEFLISGNDTILRIHTDSTALDFVKYDIGKCSNIGVYSHLVNSRFIAGKYYALSDTAHRHHIIFTKCGDIEGAEFIAPYLKGFTNYSVVTRGFFTEPDQMSLYDSRDTRMSAEAITLQWQVTDDSLILGDHIVLVRMR
jgi:hypothetical protein